jgi:hypothetical protein
MSSTPPILAPNVDAHAWEVATGWELQDRGWCSGDRCVSLAGIARNPDGTFGTESLAAALGRATHRHGDLVAIGPEFGSGSGAAAGAALPDLTLTDRQGNPVSLASLVARRRRMVIHAWAPW